MENVAVGTKVWTMFENKPYELEVSKIIETSEMIVGSETANVVIKIYVSFSATYQHELEVLPTEIFATKTALENFVFDTNL